MTESNQYKEWVAGIFDRSSATYDRVGPRFFTHFGKGLVEYSDIRPGTRVLDVACGKGAVLIPASAKTGESGEVIGIDISSGMVSRLENELKHLGITNASATVMDAEDLQFRHDSFDHILCGMALFFFPNLDQALNFFEF
jgi:ubiquinone/menaquinone biosynthesis C-methylase UbiE